MLKVIGLSLLSSVPIFLVFFLYVMYWIRKQATGKVLVNIIGDDRYEDEMLVDAKAKSVTPSMISGQKLTDEAGTTEEYNIVPQDAIFTWWPKGPAIPKFLKVPIPTYRYVRNHSQPMQFITNGSKAPRELSAGARRAVNDDKFLRGLLQIAKDIVTSGGSVSKELKTVLLVIGLIGIASLLASGAAGFFAYQVYQRLQVISTTLGVP